MHRVRQLERELAIFRVLVEHQARGRRHERELAIDVRLANGRRQVRERLERHDRAERGELRVILEQALAQALGQLAGRREDLPLARDAREREDLLQRRFVEVSPHRARGTLVARTEQREVIVAFVVLRA